MERDVMIEVKCDRERRKVEKQHWAYANETHIVLSVNSIFTRLHIVLYMEKKNTAVACTHYHSI